ncbi:MAG TPA: hypothetical protein VF482_21845 [Trebonia sp.]
MARIWHRPSALMIAYLTLFGIAGPWPAGSFPATAAQLAHAVDPDAIVIAAFLAWWVTRGGAFARGLIIFYTAAGITGLLNSPGMRSGSLISLGLLAIYLVQIALLVSTPVYNRTRKNQTGLASDGSRLWVLPPRWMPIAAAAAGVIMTLLLLGNMSYQPVPGCQASGYLAPHSTPLAQCAALAEGYPVHYLSAMPALALNSGNKVTVANLAMFANPVISKGAAAEDLAIWTLVSFTAFYLLWLPSRRQDEPAAISEPVPA